jgi:hypothetical protein
MEIASPAWDINQAPNKIATLGEFIDVPAFIQVSLGLGQRVDEPSFWRYAQNTTATARLQIRT